MTSGFKQTPTPPSALPKIGRKKKLRPDHCLNCGTPATGKFCAECGQEIKDHSVALGPLLSEGLAELASWDSKLFRTLVPLVIRPGFLTNEYNACHRVPYLSPLKLYLIISVLFFLLLSWQNPIGNAVVISSDGLHTHSLSGRSPSAAGTATTTNTNVLIEGAMTRRLLRAKQNKTGFVSALLNDIPKMMFFLLPLFAVMLKLLYWRLKRLYGEHLIFLLHVHAFAFLILTPLLLVHPPWLLGSITFALALYVFSAMRVVYKQSRLATLWKFSLLGFGYVTLLSLCIVGTLLVALWLL